MRLLTTTTALALLLPLASIASAAGDNAKSSGVRFVKHEDKIDVSIDGKPFTTYRFDVQSDAKFARPYFFPVLAPDGTPLTSDQVVAKETDPKADHPHHRSFYVAHGNVSGADHWSLQLGEKQPRQRHVGFEKMEGDTIVEKLEWETADRKGVLLHETRTLRFVPVDDNAWAIDLTLAFTPAGGQPVTFHDTKEAGLCSVRVVKAISSKPAITLSTGATGEKASWGKPAAWCDTSGEIDGKPYGVAILDHPSNPRHPTHWHVRAYGLMAANPFGLHDYDKKANPPGSGDMKLEPGKTTTFRYRVVFHAGDAKGAGIEQKFKEFAESK